MKKNLLLMLAISAIFQTTNTMIRLGNRLNQPISRAPLILRTPSLVRTVAVRNSSMNAYKASKLFGLNPQQVLSATELNERKALLQILYSKVAQGAQSADSQKNPQEKVQEIDQAYAYLSNYHLNLQKLSTTVKLADSKSRYQVIANFLEYYEDTNSIIDLGCPEIQTNNLFKKGVAAKARSDQADKLRNRCTNIGFYLTLGLIVGFPCMILIGQMTR